MQVSQKAAHLIGSEIIKLAGEINALKAQGKDILNLTIGDFDPAVFPLPQALSEGIQAAYRAGKPTTPLPTALPPCGRP
jgi:aspartate aminotransferase